MCSLNITATISNHNPIFKTAIPLAAISVFKSVAYVWGKKKNPLNELIVDFKC